MKDKEFRNKKQKVSMLRDTRKELQQWGRIRAKQNGTAFRTKKIDDEWRLVEVSDKTRKETETEEQKQKDRDFMKRISKRKTSTTKKKIDTIKKITKKKKTVEERNEEINDFVKAQKEKHKLTNDERNDLWTKKKTEFWRSLSDQEKTDFLLEQSPWVVHTFAQFDEPISKVPTKKYTAFKNETEDVILDGMFTDPRYYEVKKDRKFTIKEMTASEYLTMCERNRSGWSRQFHREDDVKKYSKAMLKGDEFPMTYIQMGGGQEGRHRALAYREAFGYNAKMPVMIVEEYDYYQEPFYKNYLKKRKELEE